MADDEIDKSIDTLLDEGDFGKLEKACEAEVMAGLQAQLDGEEVDEDRMFEAGSILVAISLMSAGVDPDVVMDQLDRRDYDLNMKWNPETGLEVIIQFTDGRGFYQLSMERDD